MSPPATAAGPDAADPRRPGREPGDPRRLGRADALALAVLALACLIVFLTAPTGGEFLWSESPRNALNGAFVLDLLREMPLRNPTEWATAYYLKYPALTILFYPPLLSVAVGLTYAVLGVSHWAAMACISLFLLGLAAATYFWARRIAGPPAALAAALLLLAAPELLQWGQQVLLEIPMLALATGGALFLARYGEAGRPWDLAAAVLLLVLAAYTKQTAVFVAAGLLAGLLLWRGPGLLARRHVWVIAILAAVALVPLVLLQLKFGSFNLTSAAERSDMAGPARFSLESLSWYAVRLPAMLGWPALLLAAAAAFVLLRGRSARPMRGDLLLLLGWLAATYVALSLIALKETRHGLPLLVPLAILAAVTLDRLAGFRPVRPWLPAAAAAALGLQLWLVPTRGATGYREAADLVAAAAPPGARVMFAGNRDGAFIFNMRTQERQDLSVIRADKLFLNIAVMPGLGLNPRDVPSDEIAAMMNRYGISHIVTVPRVWAEAPVMARLDEVLHSAQFEEVARIPVTGPVEERELVVYRNLGTLADPPANPSISLPAVGMTLSAR